MKQNIFKNVALKDPLDSSPYITLKHGEKKKKRKKNSYTDKFIDKKKLTIEYETTEKVKKQKRSITLSKKEPKTIVDKSTLNEINYQDNTKIDTKNDRLEKIDNKVTNKQISKNHSYQNFNIKLQFLPKNKNKFISSGETSLNKVKNKPENNTSNLNSNIILINNNNINYTNKNDSENEDIRKIKERQNINIILSKKIQRINENESINIKEKVVGNKEQSEYQKIKNIIIENNKQILTNEDIFQNEKVKNLLITNLSDITNNISNIYSNTEQSVNSYINNNIKLSKSNSNSKINEYCFKKNHSKGNTNNNFPNENTYSKERILTNYNNDFEANISDIKKNKIKNDVNDNNYFFNNTIDNGVINESKEIVENTNTIIKNNLLNEPYREFKHNKKNNLNVLLKNEKEINIRVNTNKDKDNILYENINKNLTKDYKIYDVNTFRMISKEEKMKNNSKDESNENKNDNENDDIEEKKNNKNNNKINKNEFINSKNFTEKENLKNKKINLDEYINKAKEKLNQIRNKSNLNNNIISKAKIKSTLNYILNQNNEFLNDEYKKNENEQNENGKNILNNIKGNQNSKFLVKTSNRMENYLLNIKEVNNRKNNFKKNNKNNEKHSNNNNIQNIKSIVDKNKIEVFDEEEFMQIKKRNLSSNKINISKVNEDLKYLENTLKLPNMNIYHNIGKKIFIDENILPPNNFDFKEIFNRTLINNIIKK